MRALQFTAYGGPELLTWGDAPVPHAGPEQIRIAVRAASVNPVDWKTRQNGGQIGPPPFTVGWDVAGVVEEVGRGVTRFAVGDRVFGMPNFPSNVVASAAVGSRSSKKVPPLPPCRARQAKAPMAFLAWPQARGLLSKGEHGE